MAQASIRKTVRTLLLLLAVVIIFLALSRMSFLRDTTRQLSNAFEAQSDLGVMLGHSDALLGELAAAQRILRNARTEADVARFEARFGEIMTRNPQALQPIEDAAAQRLDYGTLTQAGLDTANLKRAYLQRRSALSERYDNLLRLIAGAQQTLADTRDRLLGRAIGDADVVESVGDQLIHLAELSRALEAVEDWVMSARPDLRRQRPTDDAPITLSEDSLDRVSGAATALGRDGISIDVSAILQQARDSRDQTRQFETSLDRFADSLDLFDTVIARTSSELHAMVDAATTNAIASEQAIVDLIKRSVVQEIMFSGIGAGVILLIVYALLEFRVIRRLDHLTQAVLSIADGDLDQPVDVMGDDELGQMAKALEVFRGTAVDLQRSNEDLGNFAYVASHDLRTPLRAIRDLAEWTLEDHGDDMVDGVRRNLDIIIFRADRMMRLLSDLLEYARIGQSEETAGVVDLRELVEDISDLANPNGAFRIEYEGAGHATTYATPLKTILLNLVANAIRHHDQETGEIKITSRIADDFLQIEVLDDGPGIDPKHHERIFDLFKTLKRDEDLRNTGLGLALVRKLVAELDGQIAVSSNPTVKRGTSFTLRIPLVAHAVSNSPVRTVTRSLQHAV